MPQLLKAALLLCPLLGVRADCTDREECAARESAVAEESPHPADEAGKSKSLIQLQKRGGASDQLEKGASARGDWWWWEKKTTTTTQAPVTNQEDSLTVMILNAYLLEVKVFGHLITGGPNLAQRSREQANWFKTLKSEEVPDVLVLNEIFDSAGEHLLKSICTDSFRVSRPWWEWKATFMSCDSSSHFAYTTTVSNPTTKANPIANGGVVVLVKKGLKMESVHDETFNWVAPYEFLARKGFWVTRVSKGGRKFWVVGTHVSAYHKYTWQRKKQFAQIRRYLDRHAKRGDRVVIAGDMNIYTKAQTVSTGEVITPDMLETDTMLNLLGDTNAPATGGELVRSGFWLPLNKSLDYSWDEVDNHLTDKGSDSLKPRETPEGNHMYDWVLVPGAGDRFAGPTSMKRQVVPLLADACFASEQKKGVKADDLSDHYAIFAKLCYQSSCAQVAAIAGHRGSTGNVPSNPVC